ncbi:MAG: alanine--tRNA ligase [Desulfobacteraceae bacterium]|nr:MAG: alanine--tRNA ligase [Desulfobacteraceae bacterium]
MNFREIRRCFLDFFKARDHEIIESSSLIPRDDPTLMFTNAGMVQFKRLFLGEEKRHYNRAATSQKCVRAGGKHNDLDNVGYTARHHTFFEMLGNFSFGDYFKEEAITWAWELLTSGYKLPADRLYVSVYKDDEEAYRIWQERIGISPGRIVKLGEKDNFWAMGDTGPCGPCSEILIDQGPDVGCRRPECAPGCDCDRFLEIWNLVFTQFDRSPEGILTPLPRPNIDTGMGLERISAVVQGVKSNYDTDLFRGIIGRLEDLAGTGYSSDGRKSVPFRVISDHIRAITFLIGDGVLPSNEGRGYVLRRIIRRAIRFGHVLGLKDPFLSSLSEKTIELMGSDYGELVRSRNFIHGVISNEERRFADTLHYSLKVLDEAIGKIKSDGKTVLPGELAFKLYDTYGLSLDIVQDVARDEGFTVDLDGYEKSMSRQRTQSQESWKGSGEEEIPAVFRSLMGKGLSSRFNGYASTFSNTKVTAVLVKRRESDSCQQGEEAEIILDETPFYARSGGQVGDTGWLLGEGLRFRVDDTVKFGDSLIVHKGQMEMGRLSPGLKVEARVDEEARSSTALNHTATHLLHKALREVLGDHVKQAGSLVAPTRLRFDFSHFTHVTPEQLLDVENYVNARIRENLPVSVAEMAKDDAVKTGAMAIFEEKYGAVVRLVSVGDGVSRELCGGTHTERTGDIGIFRIVSEGAVAANVRRIEALTGRPALEYDQKRDGILKQAAAILKVAPDEVIDRLQKILQEQKTLEKEMESLKGKLLSDASQSMLSRCRDINGIKVIAQELKVESPKELREAADQIKERLPSGIILLASEREGKVMLICVVSGDLVKKFQAGEIIKVLSEIVGGKGGGRPDMAQGGGTVPGNLPRAFESLYEMIGQKTS